jgi:hypothetical protein
MPKIKRKEGREEWKGGRNPSGNIDGHFLYVEIKRLQKIILMQIQTGLHLGVE